MVALGRYLGQVTSPERAGPRWIQIVDWSRRLWPRGRGAEERRDNNVGDTSHLVLRRITNLASTQHHTASYGFNRTSHKYE